MKFFFIILKNKKKINVFAYKNNFKKYSFSYFFLKKNTSSLEYSHYYSILNKSKNLINFVYNIFFFKLTFFFIPTNFFLKSVKLINWFFNKTNIFFYNEDIFLNFSSLFNKSPLIVRFFKIFKNNIFFIFDSFSNLKILFFLKRLKKKSIAVPFSKEICWIIYWPIVFYTYKNLIFHNSIVDFYFFKLIIKIRAIS